MIATVRPKRIELYPNPHGKTMAQVKNETGCTHIINGGLFDSLSSPNCQLKINGRVYVDDGYRYWGFAWNDASDFAMEIVPCNKSNYIACVDLLRNGQNGDMVVNPSIGGSRQRTAIGKTADGSIVLYCTQSGRTPLEVREEMRNAGCVDALMLDGGLSSQCDFDGWVLRADRKVHNFICIWAEGEDMVLKKGSKGAEVKELQNKLNKLGYGLTVDGDFGTKTHNAVMHFQNYWGLSADGVVGSATQKRIDKAISFIESDNPLVRNAALCVGLSEPSDDDLIINEYNSIAGTHFALNAAWCQIFAVVMQDRAGYKPYLTASCTAAMYYYKQHNAWLGKPQVGTLVYFDLDFSGDCDHVGVVAEVEGSTIYVIEGNSSGSGYDAVRCKTYTVGNKQIVGYAKVDIKEKTAYDIAIEKGIVTASADTVVTVSMLCEVLKKLNLI